MIALDTNILVYAHRQEYPQHKKALQFLTDLIEKNEGWAISVFSLAEFLRLVTHPRIHSPPSTLEEAWGSIQELRLIPSLRLLHPGERFIDFFKVTSEEAKASGNLVFDAQIVATLLENGIRKIITSDRDFRRFNGIEAEIF